MSRMRVALVALAAVLLASCGGGGFVPEFTVFTGQFKVDGTSIGNFDFTVLNGNVAGQGTIVHNEQPVTVTLAGFLNGTTIDAQVDNASLGHGDFDGAFSNGSDCSGTFTYTDAGGITTQTGTWTASGVDTQP